MATRNLLMKFTADASQALTEMDKLKGKQTGPGQGTGVEGVAASLNKSYLSALAVGTSVVGIGAAINKVMTDFVDYTQKVDALASAYGISNEESQALITMSDTFGLSIGGLYTALNNLVEEGFDPTLQGLSDFKTELDMKDDADKAVSMLETLGTEGQQALAPLVSGMDAVELRGYFDALLAGSTDVNDAMIKNAQDLAIATAELDIAWGGLKLQFANWSAPGLTALIDMLMRPFTPDSAAMFIKQFFGGKLGGGGGLETYKPAPEGLTVGYVGTDNLIGHAAGGSFTVGGSGGTDSQPVNFMATPGETVSIGGGTGDMQNVLAEMRRLVNTLPIAIVDAMERR